MDLLKFYRYIVDKPFYVTDNIYDHIALSNMYMNDGIGTIFWVNNININDKKISESSLSVNFREANGREQNVRYKLRQIGEMFQLKVWILKELYKTGITIEQAVENSKDIDTELMFDSLNENEQKVIFPDRTVILFPLNRNEDAYSIKLFLNKLGYEDGYTREDFKENIRFGESRNRRLFFMLNKGKIFWSTVTDEEGLPHDVNILNSIDILGHKKEEEDIDSELVWAHDMFKNTREVEYHYLRMGDEILFGGEGFRGCFQGLQKGKIIGTAFRSYLVKLDVDYIPCGIPNNRLSGWRGNINECYDGKCVEINRYTRATYFITNDVITESDIYHKQKVYEVKDLKFFADNKILFYEVMGNKPALDETLVNDGVGTIMYIKEFAPNRYAIAWNEVRYNSQEFYDMHNDGLLRYLNEKRLIPIEFWKHGEQDTEKLFDQLNESEDLEWAENIVSNTKKFPVVKVVNQGRFYPTHLEAFAIAGIPGAKELHDIKGMYYTDIPEYYDWVRDYNNGNDGWESHEDFLNYMLPTIGRPFNGDLCYLLKEDIGIGGISLLSRMSDDKLFIMSPEGYKKVDNLNESENDDLEWAEDIVKEMPNLSVGVKVTGKRFAITSGRGITEGWRTIAGWQNCYKVVGLDMLYGEQCYIVKLDNTYDRVYIPVSQFSKEDFCN